MVIGLLIGICALVLIAVLLLIFLVIRSGKPHALDLQPIQDAIGKSEVTLRGELGVSRTEAANASRETRQELGTNLMTALSSMNGSLTSGTEQSSLQSAALRQEIQGMMSTLAEALRSQLTELFTTNNSLISAQIQRVEQLAGITEKGLEKIRAGLEENLKKFQQSTIEAAQMDRKEIGDRLASFSETMHKQFTANIDSASKQFESFNNQIQNLTTNNEGKMEGIRQSVETRLQSIQEDNGKRLEEMRQTVDEKLHLTLETRLGESFKIVSERLDLVHAGLGEMKALGAGVGDLKRVLSGVKTRGILGEVLLGSLLEQMLSPDQYEKNVCVRDGSAERVDYAIKMPGQDGTRSYIYLSIDSKFPLEDFQRLLVAYEEANVEQIEIQLKQLEARIKAEGRSIRDKYINVPLTCDFAILFLPNENLFAEVLRRPGLQEYLARECHVTVCGPTNLAGFLNSLSMGFRTLAIAKKSSEVWGTLGVVKTEFGKFSQILEGVKKKLIDATEKIDTAATRSRAIERKLRDVEALPIIGGTEVEDGDVEAMPELLTQLPKDFELI